MRNLRLLAVLLLFVPAGIAHADWGWGDNKVKERETFERSVDVDPRGRISIETVNGSIEVETWDRDEVEIQAVKEARAGDRGAARELLAETEIVIDDRDGLEVRVNRPRRGFGGRRGNISVSFTLRIPRGAARVAETTNGNVSVEGLAGSADVNTTNGSVRLDDIGGDTQVITTNGSITALGLRGRFGGRTTNGSITAEILADSLNEDMRLTTTNGSIELMVSSNLAASIVARAGNGRIINNLEGRELVVSRGSLDLELAGGGLRIDLRTTNGRIELTPAN
jgi:hypothetical protein